MIRLFVCGQRVPEWLQKVESPQPYSFRFSALLTLVVRRRGTYYVEPVIWGPATGIMEFVNKGPLDTIHVHIQGQGNGVVFNCSSSCDKAWLFLLGALFAVWFLS